MLGFEAQVPLREGLRRTIDWTRARPPLIETCVAKHAEQMAALDNAMP